MQSLGYCSGMDANERLLQKVRHLVEQGIEQKTLAGYVGMHPVTFSRWLRSRTGVKAPIGADEGVDRLLAKLHATGTSVPGRVKKVDTSVNQVTRSDTESGIQGASPDVPPIPAGGPHDAERPENRQTESDNPLSLALQIKEHADGMFQRARSLSDLAQRFMLSATSQSPERDRRTTPKRPPNPSRIHREPPHRGRKSS